MRRRCDLAGARERQERALRINEAAYGPDHPEVASTLTNLGIVLEGLGDLAGARDRQERALQIFQTAYGPDPTPERRGVHLKLLAVTGILNQTSPTAPAVRVDSSADLDNDYRDF